MIESNKITLRVPDMTCAHCVRTITTAIEQAIPEAQVQANLNDHLVTVTGAPDAAKIAAIIRAQDYTPTLV